MAPETLKNLRDELRRELTENILPFWMEKTLDETNGGFIGEMSNDLTVKPDAPKSLVVTTRILWTFSAAARILRDGRYLGMAERALDFLKTRFADPEYGGYFWWLDSRGEPLETDKKIYGQVFTVYALAQHHRTTGRKESLDAARSLSGLIEEKALDREGVGYHDFCGRDWSLLGNFALGDGEIPAEKTMNTHLHVLEAYTNLYRVSPSEKLARRLRMLIEIHLDRILDVRTGHLNLFFDREWKALTDEVSYGHDIEGSWLLCEAADLLGDPGLSDRARDTAVRMAGAVLADGVDPDGGMIYHANPRGVVDPNKHWWPQAEAVVGFLNAWQIGGDPRFLDASLNAWRFIQKKLIDRRHGEWFWSVTRDGRVNAHEPKVSPWKCPYHNGRMCMEVIERVDRLEKEG
ncbi:MAG TPA: N-acyl-D-glucosamine 2-epimerase [bacterium]|mgnify:CR=1 FL=1|nr:N-acyl-D-glucosamine 2-epimerase [bacterium]